VSRRRHHVRPFVRVDVFCARGHPKRLLYSCGRYTDERGERFTKRFVPGPIFHAHAAPGQAIHIKQRLLCPSCPLDSQLLVERYDAMVDRLWRPGARETRDLVVV